MQKKILEAFCDKRTVSNLAKEEKISYEKVYTFYNKLRLQIAQNSEMNFLNNIGSVGEYEEFLYIPKYKKNDPNALYKAQNIMVFDYRGKIYTTLMTVEDKYTPENIDIASLKKIFTFKKIAKIKKHNNQIEKFINFFELEMHRFKGVSSEMFFYYLKECEFLFNYQEYERKEILKV